MSGVSILTGKSSGGGMLAPGRARRPESQRPAHATRNGGTAYDVLRWQTLAGADLARGT